MTSTDNATDLGPQRRRGAALEDAILDAAWEELTAVGYSAFSMENVAVRARTGKASIYRRWPARSELVMDALLDHMPTPDEACTEFEPANLPDSVTTAEALRTVGRSIARVLTSPTGRVIRAVKLEAASDPDLARLIDARFQSPRREAMIRLLQRGVARGDVRPDAANAAIADVLPAVLMHRVLMQQQPVREVDVQDIIDTVMIPLVEVRRSP